MISTIFGLPGAGKSTTLAYCADLALKGKPVEIGHKPFWRVPLTAEKHYQRIYCNFPIKGCYMLNWDDIGKYDFSHSLILLDEITLLADSRKWKNFDDAKTYFFSMHRHYHCSIIIASQAYDDMDKRIRDRSAQFFYIVDEGSYSRIFPIKPSFRVETMSKSYTLQARLCTSKIKRKKYYDMFDSFSAVAMPENPAKLWEVV